MALQSLSSGPENAVSGRKRFLNLMIDPFRARAITGVDRYVKATEEHFEKLFDIDAIPGCKR
jgi:hypothetical protein